MTVVAPKGQKRQRCIGSKLVTFHWFTWLMESTFGQNAAHPFYWHFFLTQNGFVCTWQTVRVVSLWTSSAYQQTGEVPGAPGSQGSKGTSLNEFSKDVLYLLFTIKNCLKCRKWRWLIAVSLIPVKARRAVGIMPEALLTFAYQNC